MPGASLFGILSSECNGGDSGGNISTEKTLDSKDIDSSCINNDNVKGQAGTFLSLTIYF